MLNMMFENGLLKNAGNPKNKIFDGSQIYHNYVRPHMGLDGKTPAEMCGIEIKGNNKWITLIQNAKQRRTDNSDL